VAGRPAGWAFGRSHQASAAPSTPSGDGLEELATIGSAGTHGRRPPGSGRGA
jgi:hypothetical protein